MSVGGSQQLTLLARGKLSQAAGEVCVFQWLQVFVGMHLWPTGPWATPGYNSWAREETERYEEKEGEMKKHTGWERSRLKGSGKVAIVLYKNSSVRACDLAEYPKEGTEVSSDNIWVSDPPPIRGSSQKLIPGTPQQVWYLKTVSFAHTDKRHYGNIPCFLRSVVFSVWGCALTPSVLSCLQALWISLASQAGTLHHGLSCWQPWRYFAIVLFHLAHKCLHTVSRVARSKSLMTSWCLEEKLPQGVGQCVKLWAKYNKKSPILCRKLKTCSEKPQGVITLTASRKCAGWARSQCACT